MTRRFLPRHVILDFCRVMTSRAIPLQDLAQRMTQQQLELEKLRQEYEARQAQLQELTRRKEELQTQIRHVEAEIQGIGHGSKPPESKPAPQSLTASEDATSADAKRRPMSRADQGLTADNVVELLFLPLFP
jgi:TolA-binding protein